MREKIRVPGGFLFFSIVLFAAIAMPFLLRITVVKGDSMLPALENGDRLLIDRLSYHLGKPKRFDVVMFSYPYKPNTYYIKRVIALPGETVRIDAEGMIYVNEKPLSENYGNAPIRDGGLAANALTLGEDEYFVLGDNRNFSMDSREPDVGNIRESDIVGKGWLCVFPFSRFGVIR